MGADPHDHRPGRGHWHRPRPRGIPAKRARPIRRGRGRARTPRTRETSDSPRVRGQRGLPIPVPDARIPQGQATGMGRGGVPMKITPLAADSLGARSMATLVETPDVTVLIDPSVRLGPYRYDLRPHPTEKDRQKELWQRIRSAAKSANVLTVSHYHYDHHNPDAPSIFRGKLAFLKDGKFHINRSQRERAGAFVRALKKYPKEIQVADGNQMDFGGTELLFSPALPHGYNDELGYVVMTRIAQGNEVFVHTADVLGPPLKEHHCPNDGAQPCNASGGIIHVCPLCYARWEEVIPEDKPAPPTTAPKPAAPPTPAPPASAPATAPAPS